MTETKRIALISPCGWGNLGDAAIIDSVIAGIRRRLPGAEIVGFTQNPEDTTRRHGIPAFTLSGRSSSKPDLSDDSPGPNRPPSRFTKLRRAIGAVPGARKGYRFASLVLADRQFQRRMRERVGGFDVVVVAGGGQLDDFWGGTFGHPYTLWRWGRLARRVGARYVILSVGTGSLATRLSALFVRRALALAEYRSFRDARSRELVGAPSLTASDPIVPDLAYALPDTAQARAQSQPVFGLSPMVYNDPRAWPVKNEARYRSHLASFAGLAVRLARAGHDVILFASATRDMTPVRELRQEIDAQLDPEQRARIQVAASGEVAELMRTLASVDVVVAARLHGVLLAHVAGRPALAISHERKVRTLMENMGQERFCLDIVDFDAEVGWQRLQEVAARRVELAQDIRRTVESYRRRVEEQFDRVFGVVR